MRRTVVVVMASVALVLAGCSSDGDAPSNRKTTTVELTTVVLPAADVQKVTGGTVTVEASNAGNSVASTDATFADCDGSYPSEKHRAQRLQQGYADQPGRISASVEVVRYAAGWSDKAYAEEKAALKGCSEIKDVTAAQPGSGLARQRIVTTATQLSPSGNGAKIYVVSVYQWHDDLLGAVYVYRPKPDEALHDGLALGKVMSTRLGEVG